MIAGAVAFVAVDRQRVFAAETPSAEEAAAVPGTENDGAGPPAEAPAADAPPADTPATETAAAPAPVTPKTYTVAAGDTMFSIAKRHGVSVDAVLWANNLTDANTLKQGQKLTIPPSTGKLHTAKEGDTLDALATSYGVSKAGIATVNGLTEDAALKAGQRLLIPSKPPVSDPALAPTSVPVTAASTDEPVAIGSGATGSPTPPLISNIAPVIQVPGIMTATGAPTVKVTNRTIQKMSWPVSINAPKSGVSQGFRPGHTGIDIYAPQGTEIKAAAAGTIKLAEKNPDGFSGYGWIVIVEHGDGVSSWYAHCGSFAVKEGDKVKVGDKLGTVGMTGRTTGPHLHFEVRVAMSAIDPRLVLP